MGDKGERVETKKKKIGRGERRDVYEEKKEKREKKKWQKIKLMEEDWF